MAGRCHLRPDGSARGVAASSSCPRKTRAAAKPVPHSASNSAQTRNDGSKASTDWRGTTAACARLGATKPVFPAVPACPRRHRRGWTRQMRAAHSLGVTRRHESRLACRWEDEPAKMDFPCLARQLGESSRRVWQSSKATQRQSGSGLGQSIKQKLQDQEPPASYRQGEWIAWTKPPAGPTAV